MPRGRPKKEVYETPDDQLASIILKLFDIECNPDGTLKYVRSDRTLTLEEYAVVDWYQNGCKGKPVSKVGQMKREDKLFKNIKTKCHKAGYTDEDLRNLIYDMSNPHRTVVTSKFGSNSVDC